MRYGRIIGLLLLLAVLLPACRRQDPDPVAGQEPSLTIGIDFPRTGQSKAGELQASNEENKINSLQLWVFRSSGHELVGYLDIPAADVPAGGGVKWYTLQGEGVTWEFVNAHPNVDIFVLANAASIGVQLDGNSGYNSVSSAAFGKDDTHDYFGITSFVKEVGSDGLPMSGKAVNRELYGSAPELKVDAVQICRAVSRLRMVFCKTKTEGEQEDVRVTGITFYESMFPLKEYVFTTEKSAVVKDKTPLADNYLGAFTLQGPATLQEHEVPESLMYVNQTPEDYQALLNEAVEAGKLTNMGYYYLRESDQRIIGRIDYTVGGKPRFREFAMSAAGDFARNHTWTLFAYFMSGRNIQLSLVVQPWDRSDYKVDFSDQAVNVTSKFVVDDNSAEVTPGSEYQEVKLIPGTPAKGHLYITTPVGGTLMIYPKGAASLFIVSPEQATIDPETHSGRIDIEIRNNPGIDIDIDDLPESETSITLSFSVEINGREINVDSEVIDNKYRFHL